LYRERRLSFGPTCGRLLDSFHRPRSPRTNAHGSKYRSACD
uniref:IlGF domain-containing protein n=1 Tax=Haemonchus placei TaxID=6290 RepID=A0A0N4X3G0_HAEPC